MPEAWVLLVVAVAVLAFRLGLSWPAIRAVEAERFTRLHGSWPAWASHDGVTDGRLEDCWFWNEATKRHAIRATAIQYVLDGLEGHLDRRRHVAEQQSKEDEQRG